MIYPNILFNFFEANWKYLSEIFILWFFFYMLLAFLQGTRAIQVLKGLIILVVIFVLTEEFDLQVIHWILTKLFTISVLAFLIIFQPELRRGLARIGQFGIFYRERQVLDELAKAAVVLSKKKCGALIAIEREIGLKTYIESGVVFDSQVSSEIITTVFFPNTPLHDGGIIIQGSRLVAAGCLFPLTQNPNTLKPLGTRHRAAIGLSEETDAIVIVVSEETGEISLATSGRLIKNIGPDDFEKFLASMYRPKKSVKSFFDFWSRSAFRAGGA